MTLVTVTAPTVEPVTVAEAKAAARIDDTDQDVIDNLLAIDREAAALTRERNLQAAREQAAAAHRSRP